MASPCHNWCLLIATTRLLRPLPTGITGWRRVTVSALRTPAERSRIFDSYGFPGPMTPGDCGGVYELEDGGGSPPAVNAARPPDEWQSLRIWFQAPRFDASGKLVARPTALRVLLNETPVPENLTLPGPTGSHMNIPEAAVNPIMLQGDHGPVAYRNLYIKEFQ